MKNRPIAILTALPVEYSAVRRLLNGLEQYHHSAGTVFETGTLIGLDGQIVLGQVGRGNHSSAVLTERAIAEFDPLAIFFVGVAGGLQPHVRLGDVVVATHVYAAHGSTSEDDGDRGRPRAWPVSHGLEQAAYQVDRARLWSASSPSDGREPRVHFGPVVAGEVVLNSTHSAHATWIRDHFNDALAVEMEAAGFAQAAQLNQSTPMAVVRGISDRADGTKDASGDASWQPTAVANAAAFTLAFASELIKTARTSSRRTERTDDRNRGRNGDMGDVTNNASGSARVGIQVGHVHGNMHFTDHPEPVADLVTELQALRLRLLQLRADGELDGDTYEAACDELDTADEAARERPSTGSGRLLVALKKLRGLLDDVADLAVKLTGIIALVRGLT